MTTPEESTVFGWEVSQEDKTFLPADWDRDNDSSGERDDRSEDATWVPLGSDGDDNATLLPTYDADASVGDDGTILIPVPDAIEVKPIDAPCTPSSIYPHLTLSQLHSMNADHLRRYASDDALRRYLDRYFAVPLDETLALSRQQLVSRVEAMRRKVLPV